MARKRPSRPAIDSKQPRSPTERSEARYRGAPPDHASPDVSLKRFSAAEAPIFRAVTSEELYSAIIESLAIAFDANASAVLKVAEQKLRLVSSKSLSMKQLRSVGCNLGERILGKLAMRGGYYFSPNPDEAMRRCDPIMAFRVKTERTTLVVAVFSTRTNRKIERRQSTILERLCLTIGHGLQSADRIEVLQNELSALRDLSSLSAAGRKIAVILDNGLMWAKKIVPSERRVVVLEDRMNHEMLVIKAVRGDGAQFDEDIAIPREGSLAGDVLDGGAPRSYPSLMEVPRLVPDEPYLDGPLLALPLSANDERIGVMVLCRQTSRAPFEISEQKALETVATQLAMAIQAAVQYEIAVEHGEELFAILRSISDGVMVATRSGDLMVANPASLKLLGIDSEGDLTPEQEGQTVREVFGDLALDTDVEKEIEPLSRRGRTLKVKLAPFIGGDGVQRGVVAALDDVTREKELARAKDTFLSSVSHELRTPLTSIMSSVAVLKRYGAKGDDTIIVKFASIIGESSERLLDIVQQCLDLSNLEQGFSVWSFKMTSLGAVLTQCIADHYTQLENKSITLDREIPPTLPPTAADNEKLSKAFANVLSDAIHATGKGGKIEVGARLLEDETAIEVWVTDYVREMTEREMWQAFQAFQQVDDENLCKRHDGLGVKLPICKAIVERHGGDVGLESGPGGTRCFFTVPIQDPGDLRSKANYKTEPKILVRDAEGTVSEFDPESLQENHDAELKGEDTGAEDDSEDGIDDSSGDGLESSDESEFDQAPEQGFSDGFLPETDEIAGESFDETDDVFEDEFSAGYDMPAEEGFEESGDRFE